MSVSSLDELLQYIRNDISERCVPPEKWQAVILQEVQINSFYLFASSFTAFMLSSKLVSDTVIVY
jgi:hypothetical protein